MRHIFPRNFSFRFGRRKILTTLGYFPSGPIKKAVLVISHNVPMVCVRTRGETGEDEISGSGTHDFARIETSRGSSSLRETPAVFPGTSPDTRERRWHFGHVTSRCRRGWHAALTNFWRVCIRRGGESLCERSEGEMENRSYSASLGRAVDENWGIEIRTINLEISRRAGEREFLLKRNAKSRKLADRDGIASILKRRWEIRTFCSRGMMIRNYCVKYSIYSYVCAWVCVSLVSISHIRHTNLRSILASIFN